MVMLTCVRVQGKRRGPRQTLFICVVADASLFWTYCTIAAKYEIVRLRAHWEEGRVTTRRLEAIILAVAPVKLDSASYRRQNASDLTPSQNVLEGQCKHSTRLQY